LIALVATNTLILATLWICFEPEKPAKANLESDDFNWRNQSADDSFNTTNVSVQGAIRNSGSGNCP
jgi:hypothetical protein